MPFTIDDLSAALTQLKYAIIYYDWHNACGQALQELVVYTIEGVAKPLLRRGFEKE